jgi:RHS repeat-associated protein
MGAYTPKDNSDFDRAALANAKVFENTPHISIVGSLGKAVEVKQLNVTSVEQNCNYSVYDVLGNVITQSDQRLQKIGAANFETTYNSGIPVKVVSADAGTSWSFTNVIGHPIYHKDSRGFEQYSTYDSLQRPLEVMVTDGDLAQGALKNTVKRFEYRDTVGKNSVELVDDQNANVIGSAIAAFDESGLHLTPAHSIAGTALTSRQYIKSEYKTEANWSGISSKDIDELLKNLVKMYSSEQLEKLELPKGINELMLVDTFLTSSTHNAIGQGLSATDADGNVQKPTYDSLGREQTLSMTAGTNAKAANKNGSTPGTTSITYNAKGKQTKEISSNGVVTTHSYDEKNFRLTNIKSTRKEATGANISASGVITTLQDLTYHHDPVGNVCSVTNNAIPITYFNNQQVDANADYTFNSLYKLIKATGREQAGMWSNIQSDLNKQYIPNQFAGQKNNGAALQNYTQTYSYDAGGNLLTQNQTGGLSRTTTIQPNNNRIDTGGTGSTTPNAYKYDVHGNMLTLKGTAGVSWNYRDNMASATQIERTDGTNDTEYYIYDGGGGRVRKISEQLGTNGTTNITEALYAGGIEIRRNGTSGKDKKKSTWNEVWHNVKLMQGRAVSCLWRYQLPTATNTTLVSQQRFQLTDLLDSSNYELDENAQLISCQEYYPYGGTSIITATNATEVANKYYQYSSQEKDKTGLYYYGMRYYVPWLGRWTCTDPAGTVDGLNVYAFVTGNPVSHVDIGGMARTKKSVPKEKPAKKAQQPGRKVIKKAAKKLEPPKKKKPYSGKPRKNNTCPFPLGSSFFAMSMIMNYKEGKIITRNRVTPVDFLTKSLGVAILEQSKKVTDMKVSGEGKREKQRNMALEVNQVLDYDSENERSSHSLNIGRDIVGASRKVVADNIKGELQPGTYAKLAPILDTTFNTKKKRETVLGLLNKMIIDKKKFSVSEKKNLTENEKLHFYTLSTILIAEKSREDKGGLKIDLVENAIKSLSKNTFKEVFTGTKPKAPFAGIGGAVVFR